MRTERNFFTVRNLGSLSSVRWGCREVRQAEVCKITMMLWSVLTVTED